jgi:hypothetical protein
MKLNIFKKALLVLIASGAIGCGSSDYYSKNLEKEVYPEEGYSAKALSKKYTNLINQYKSGNVPIREDGDPIILQWDYGSENIEVKHRQRFIEDWLPLGTSQTKEFPVSGLMPGIYEFAVYDNELNVNHTSLDSNAQPTSGWYLMHKRFPEADSDLSGKISDAEMKSFIDKWLKKRFTNQQFSVNADFYVSQK